MPFTLKAAMEGVLAGWTEDLDPRWKTTLKNVELDFGAIDPSLTLEEWEPIFPARRSKHFPGAPSGAHLLRAFDGLAPQDVKCVLLGQDPYPEPGFATGRAFEAGNVAAWRELDKMFSKSVRAFIQLIVAARTGSSGYAQSFAQWPRTLAAIESGEITLEPPSDIAQTWVDQGVLLLNSALTLTRFRVDTDLHQSRGHLPLWRPLISETLASLVALRQPLTIIAFGDVASQAVVASGVESPAHNQLLVIRREHPANADAALRAPNPFAMANAHLKRNGRSPVRW